MRGKKNTDETKPEVVDIAPGIDDDRPELTEKEQRVARYLMRLEGMLPGFPDTERKFQNVVRAVSRFVTVEPRTHTKIKAGQQEVVPMEWLVSRIEEKCQYWPPFTDIRQMYWDYWPCEDGIEPQELVTRRRAASSDTE